MSDILDRLALQAFMAEKNESGITSLFEDCLAEILRLRAENEKFFNQAEMNARLLTENSSLRAENEMLKSNLPARAATRGLAEQHNEITHLLAENEKLREALAAERERCANIAENIYYPNEGKMIAAAIRESGE